MTQRLSKQTWLEAGFAALAEAGPAALKAEPLARRLGTTKGSFYWHFDDVPAFHAALMAAWQEQAVAVVSDQDASAETPVQKLRAFARIAGMTGETRGLDPAIRAWGRDSAGVADTVAKVDQTRMTYVQALFEAIGLTNPELTRVLYAAFLGMEELSTQDGADNAGALGTLVDLILALHEAEG